MKIIFALFLTNLLFAIGTSNPINFLLETVNKEFDVYVPKIAEQTPGFIEKPIVTVVGAADAEYDWITGTSK